MEDELLINGIVVFESIGKENGQDYIEVKLKNNKIVIITATANGNLKIGIKL